jgi:hypothetical protein
MADEQTTTDQGQEQEQTTLTAAEIRNSEYFKKFTRDLSAENAALKAANEERERAEAQAQAEKEQKRLAEKGEFETILKQKDDSIAGIENQYKQKIEAMQAAHAKEIQSSKLISALNKEGAFNEFFLNGAVAAYNAEESTIDEYVAKLKEMEANAGVFGEPPKKPLKPLPHSKPSSRSTEKTLEERSAEGDNEAMAELIKRDLGWVD